MLLEIARRRRSCCPTPRPNQAAEAGSAAARLPAGASRQNTLANPRSESRLRWSGTLPRAWIARWTRRGATPRRGTRFPEGDPPDRKDPVAGRGPDPNRRCAPPLGVLQIAEPRGFTLSARRAATPEERCLSLARWPVWAGFAGPTRPLRGWEAWKGPAVAANCPAGSRKPVHRRPDSRPRRP